MDHIQANGAGGGGLLTVTLLWIHRILITKLCHYITVEIPKNVVLTWMFTHVSKYWIMEKLLILCLIRYQLTLDFSRLLARNYEATLSSGGNTVHFLTCLFNRHIYQRNIVHRKNCYTGT